VTHLGKALLDPDKEFAFDAPGISPRQIADANSSFCLKD
jgi:hypothetical protein